MFLNALLEASAKTTNIVKWVSVGAIVVLFGVIAVICIKGKKTIRRQTHRFRRHLPQSVLRFCP